MSIKKLVTIKVCLFFFSIFYWLTQVTPFASTDTDESRYHLDAIFPLINIPALIKH